jgi:ATP-dependent RNA helicase SUPV3L1/SUV3
MSGVNDVRAREAFWPGLPDGFDIVKARRHHHLVVRVDVGGLVLAGGLSAEPLMHEARAERASIEDRRVAIAARLHQCDCKGALGLLVGWWAEHRQGCRTHGIDPPYDSELHESIKCSEAEPLQRLPTLLEGWRVERSRQLRNERVARDIVRAVQIDEYGKLFPAARRLRKLTAILGPTNSGKTHLALQRLSAAASGFYAGPLRLLALEVYSRLNVDFSTPCSLVTGEERRLLPGARHYACTVEMVDPQRNVDVAVIDEAQLIADSQRGWAWTQAIACANAAEVLVLGSPQARGVIERFASMLEVELEVLELQRLSPLHVAERALGRSPQAALGNVQRGDCLVVFTRRDCLLLRDSLIALGHEVACIYGALSPEARQAQADRFTSGEAGVIVSTDAIGLGLNLRGLKRTVLVASQKFDGTSRRDVPLDLVRQIAGRAGRYGHTEEDAGVAMGLTPTEHHLVRRALNDRPTELVLERFPVAPSGEVLKRLEEVTKERRLSVLLALFVEHCSGGAYQAQLPGDALERSHAVDAYDLPIERRFLLTQVPVSTRDPETTSQWVEWVQAVAASFSSSGGGVECGIDFVSPGAGEALRLEDAERDVALLNAYCWLAMKMPSIFVDEAGARRLLLERSSIVTERLRSRSTLGARNSPERVGLPPWYWQRREVAWEGW